ncbi:MAG: family peptidase [Clostridia bacterium]|jgi:putative protease|nr:family peptidase [Clostridia bacterium]
MNKIELLAPAGSIEALEAAVESGADAVYIGGNKFNARAFADNLNEDMLKEAVAYAHIRGVKIYVTVNILILQKELEEVLEYIKYLYTLHVDAVIVQDIGLVMMIQKLLPDFEVHCSTQMAVHNTDGANLFYELGIKRVVLARELSLQEVNKIADNTGIDAEIFVHGALCVCYSGQCYMSSLIGGRSGNRGKCAQPCRKKYRLHDISKGKEVQTNRGAYLISTRDLNTYDSLYEIAASKAASLKIEGRMKRPEYVAIITHHYRAALDCIQQDKDNCISEEAAYELRIAFNREFTQGYLFHNRNQEIVSIDRPDNRGLFIGKVLNQKGNMVELLLEENFINDGDSIEIIAENGKSTGCTISGIKKDNNTVKSAKPGDKIRIFVTDRVVPGSRVNKTMDYKLFQKAREEYANKNKKKIAIKGIFTGKINEAPILEIKDRNGNDIKVIGEEQIQKAEKAAVSEEKIIEQLNKTKDTPYVFENIEIHIEPNCFLSVKAVNNLRREAIEQLSKKRIRLPQRSMEDIDIKKFIHSYSSSLPNSNVAKQELIAGVTNLHAGLSAMSGGANTIYILGDYRFKEGLKLIDEINKHGSASGCSLYYVLPQITRDEDIKELESMLHQAFERNESLGLVLSNIGHVKIAERLQTKKVRGNFTLNALNSAAMQFFIERGFGSLCVSPELNLSQIKELSKATPMQLEAVVYGYLPAMITEYCPSSAASDCDACGSSCNKNHGIMDDRNKLFRLISLGNCKTTILNSDVLCVYDNLANVMESGISKLRMDFYNEEEKDILEIVKAYKDKMMNPWNNKENMAIEEIKNKGFTKGHYFRGIE